MAISISPRRTRQRSRLEAFDRFVLHHQSTIYNLAYRILGDGQLASEVTQEAFARSFQSFTKFHGESGQLWLINIMTRICQNRLHQDLPSCPALPLDGDAFQAYLSALPLEQRIILVLSDVQGLSYGQIAEVTGVSVGVVKSRLSRGRANLRDALWADAHLANKSAAADRNRKGENDHQRRKDHILDNHACSAEPRGRAGFVEW